MYDPWESYFGTLCRVIEGSENYHKLFWQMHNTEFRPKMSMDRNRIADAYELRQSYSEVFDKPIGLLEMMVAFAMRLEHDVMAGTSARDRSSDWFWVMLTSLGLADMTDDVYDELVASKILHRFMRRRYLPNGQGGLFTVNTPGIDMRNEQLWYQAGLYLTGVLKTEGFIEP